MVKCLVGVTGQNRQVFVISNKKISEKGYYEGFHSELPGRVLFSSIYKNFKKNGKS